MPNPIIRIPVDQFLLGEQASRTVDIEVTDPTFKSVHTLPSTTGQLVGTGAQTLTDDEKQQVKDNLGISGGGGGGSGDFSSNTTSSTDGQAVVFSGTGGKTGKRFTGTGYVSAVSGVLSAASTIPKADVGLGNVDNTADASKPVSTLQAAADAAVQAYAIQRGNHTGTQASSTISDFNSATRAQVEAELVAGTNVTITPGSSGATRTLTISASGGSGGGDVSVTGTPTSGQIAEWTSATAIQGKAVTGSGNVVLATSPTLVTPALGTPSSGTLTSCTGLPVSTGVSGLGTNVATFLATPSSANLRAALTDEVGTGAAYFVGGALGTPASGTATNLTGLPVSTGISGLGTGVATALAVNVGSAGAPVVNGGALGTPSSGTLTNCTIPTVIQIACSDTSTAITAGTAKATFRMPHAMTLTAVRASVNTAPTGATIIIDINEGGSTILSTKLSIDTSEKTSTTAASAAVISDSALADDAEITIDFDQVGSTIAGAGVVVTLIGTR